jgi:hypothetical protein
LCKGNSFACLDIDYFSQIANDVRINIGADNCEKSNIVASLVQEEGEGGGGRGESSFNTLNHRE